MKKIIIWICILAFAGIIDACLYIIHSSDAVIQMHNTASISNDATTPTQAVTQNTSSSLFSSNGISHSQLVEENAAYNLTNAQMQLYNNSATFSQEATKLYQKLESSIYTSYYVNQLGYRTVVNLNNFITYDGIRYYQVFNYYVIPAEGTISNPAGVTNPNGTPYNYTGLVSTYYICATGQKLSTEKAEQDGTKNPLNQNLTDAQTVNQITKVMTEYVKGETSMPGVTASVNLNADTTVNGVTYYQATLSNPSGKQSNMQVRGAETEAMMFADSNGRIWQNKNQAFLYSGYYYNGLRFDGQTYFKNSFDPHWGTSQT